MNGKINSISGVKFCRPIELRIVVPLLSRKMTAARWETLARCFAARRLPKGELSTVVLPAVIQGPDSK